MVVRQREHREWAEVVLAWALLVPPFAILTLFTVLPAWSAYQSLARRVAERSDAVEQLKQRVGGLTATDPGDTLAEMRQRKPMFHEGASDTIAAAALQARIRGLAQARRAELIGASALPSRARDGVTYFGLRLQLTGGLHAMREALYAIETTQPAVFVDRAILSVDALHRSVSSGAAIGDRMRVELDVYGVRWVEPVVPALKRPPQ